MMMCCLIVHNSQLKCPNCKPGASCLKNHYLLHKCCALHWIVIFLEESVVHLFSNWNLLFFGVLFCHFLNCCAWGISFCIVVNKWSNKWKLSQNNSCLFWSGLLLIFGYLVFWVELSKWRLSVGILVYLKYFLIYLQWVSPLFAQLQC